MKFRIIPLLLVLALLLAACAPAATPAPLATATTAPTRTSAPPTETPAASPTVEEVVAEPTAQPIVIPDGLGGELTLASAPQRIVSLAPSTTEILFAIGAGGQIAAREDFTNYPEEALALPSVGGLSGPVSAEQIVAQKPDLVIAAPISPAELLSAVQDLDIPVVVLPNPASLDELYELLLLAGKLTARDEAAAELVEGLKVREAKVKEIVAQAETTPTVFYELDAQDPTKPWTSGAGTFIDLLIKLAGGSNVGATLTGEWAQMSQEALLVEDPDVIVLGDSKYGVTVEQVGARSGWENLSAVKNKTVFPIDDDLVSRPGPRMLDGLEELVRLIHPELADQLP